MATVTVQEAKTVLIPNRYNLFSALGEEWANGERLGLGIDPNNYAPYLAISWNRNIVGEQDLSKTVAGLMDHDVVHTHETIEATVNTFYRLRAEGAMNFIAGELIDIAAVIAEGRLLEREEVESEPA